MVLEYPVPYPWVQVRALIVRLARFFCPAHACFAGANASGRPRAQRAAKNFGCAQHMRSLGRAHAIHPSMCRQTVFSRDRPLTEAVHRQTRPALPLPPPLRSLEVRRASEEPHVCRCRRDVAGGEKSLRASEGSEEKFLAHGRKSRPPNALFSVRWVFRGGEHPSRHLRSRPSSDVRVHYSTSYTTCTQVLLARALLQAAAARGTRGALPALPAPAAL